MSKASEWSGTAYGRPKYESDAVNAKVNDDGSLDISIRQDRVRGTHNANWVSFGRWLIATFDEPK